eukprot:1707567-Amphidinium_carterae.2
MSKREQARADEEKAALATQQTSERLDNLKAQADRPCCSSAATTSHCCLRHRKRWKCCSCLHARAWEMAKALCATRRVRKSTRLLTRGVLALRL